MNRIKIKKISFVLCLLFLLCCTTSCNKDKNEIFGIVSTIVDGVEYPVSATVYVTYPEGTVEMNTTTTASNGYYEMTGVVDGTIEVWAECYVNGILLSDFQTVTVSKGDSKQVDLLVDL